MNIYDILHKNYTSIHYTNISFYLFHFNVWSGVVRTVNNLNHTHFHSTCDTPTLMSPTTENTAFRI